MERIPVDVSVWLAQRRDGALRKYNIDKLPTLEQAIDGRDMYEG
jgi:hypothetical protein